MNRGLFLPWNYEGTADGIITEGRKPEKLVPTTQQIHNVMSTRRQEKLKVLILPLLTGQLCAPGDPDGEPRGARERGWGWIFPPAFHPLEAVGPGQPLRMFAGCGVGHTVRKRPS